MELLKPLLSMALVGFVVYLIVTYIPMPAIFRTAIMIVVAIAVILWLLKVLGVAL